MIKATGFLVGVCLTVAAFLLFFDTGQSWQSEVLVEASGERRTAEPPRVSTAPVAQVDVVQAGNPTDEAVAPVQPPATADDATPSAPVEDTEGSTGQISPDASSSIVAQAESAQAVNQLEQPVPPAHETGTADAETPSEIEASRPQERGGPDVQADMAGDSDPQDSGYDGTYLFWSPFRSAWAAQGFARRLSSATQVPVEVVNTAPGKYRAAFSYQDETERLARIERIETVTGLKLE